MIEVSIIMPCLNESKSIGICIDKAFSFFQKHKISGEVIVADNGSTDGSQGIAKKKGASVISVVRKGYGHALMKGMELAQGKYLIMGDADDTYDFSNLMPFLEKMREGNDLVMGNRFRGGIASGAMPFLHRYVGNPLLSCLGRTMFSVKVSDFHCGLRGISKAAVQRLKLRTGGMEFASEMIIKAALLQLKIAEVPTTLSKDHRAGRSHLRTFRDGFRHLRILFFHQPKWFLLYPGYLFLGFGLLGLALLWRGPFSLGHLILDVHTLTYCAFFTLLGVQLISLSFFCREFGESHFILPSRYPLLPKVFGFYRSEYNYGLGILFSLLGLCGSAAMILYWKQHDFKDLVPQEAMRGVLPSALSFFLGVQLITNTLFYHLLKWGHKLSRT